MSNDRKFAVGVVITAFLLWFPITRNIIVFLLPLGSGIDDLVFLGCVAFLVTYLIGERLSGGDKQKRIFFSIIAGAVVTIVMSLLFL